MISKVVFMANYFASNNMVNIGGYFKKNGSATKTVCDILQCWLLKSKRKHNFVSIDTLGWGCTKSTIFSLDSFEGSQLTSVKESAVIGLSAENIKIMQ